MPMPKPSVWPRLRHFCVSLPTASRISTAILTARLVWSGERDRRVEQHHDAVTGIAVERALVAEDQFAKRCVIFAQHVHDLFRLGALGERGEPAQVAEHHRHLAAVAGEQRLMAVRRSDQLRDLRREETLELADAADLLELGCDALLQRLVPVLQLIGLLLQLCRLLLHRVVRDRQLPSLLVDLL